MARFTLLSAAVLLTATATAHAQYALAPRDAPEPYEDPDERAGVAGPVGFNVGGALFLPVSDSGSRFDTGAGFTAGVIFKPVRSLVGLQAEYGFSWYDLEDDILGGTGIDGSQVMHYGTLNAVVSPPGQRRFGFYLTGGGGIYLRDVEITEFAGVGAATFCDPLLFACYPAAVPVDRVVGSQDSFDFGVNGGLGAYALLAPPLRLYLEARYHYIWGPEFTTPTGNTADSDGQYLPVVLGLAF